MMAVDLVDVPQPGLPPSLASPSPACGAAGAAAVQQQVLLWF